MSQEQIKLAADELKAWVMPQESVEYAALRERAVPLIEALKAAGHIPRDASAYVELQGIWEFDLVPVFFSVNEQRSTPLNVNADGSVEVF